MADMQRIMVFDRLDQYLMDLDPRKILGAQVTLEINGEHSLTITTLQELEKTNRVVLRDNLGTWHEFVVAGLDEEHSQGGGAIARTYYCVWSLEYDTSGTYINDQFGCGVVPGHPSVPQPARRGLECALEGTARWQIGTITVTQQGSASFYRMSGWDGLKKVVERWGGELQATITVSTTGVVERHVDLLQHVGASAEEATRRFDYGSDLTKIKRTVHDEVWPCRVVPLGRSQETEAGGYTRRPGIASVNGGVDWLIDDEVADLVKVPDGSGGWEYPCAIIKNDQFEEPADIKAWALEHISEYTRPRVTYTAEVAQFAEAGLSAHEVELGDRVAVVDRTFMEGGLRIAVRVVKMKQDLLDPSGTTLIIGNAQQTLAGQLDALAGDISSVYDQSASASDWQNGSAYMDALIGRLNEEINQAGGYWYMVPGLGTRTYNVPVSDPSVGDEASAVVEISGGNIRIASSKTDGNWNWRTLIQSGLVVADTVKALDVNAGIIQSFDGNDYWDLDSGLFSMHTDLVRVIYQGTLTISSQYAEGSTIISTSEYKNYLICFTVGSGSSGWNYIKEASVYMGRASGGSYSSEVKPYRATYLTSSSYRVAAIVKQRSAYSSTFAINMGSTFSGSVTITDICVYEVPDEGSGVINFTAQNELSGDDQLATDITAGYVKTGNGGLTTSLSPGRLVFNDGEENWPKGLYFDGIDTLALSAKLDIGIGTAQLVATHENVSGVVTGNTTTATKTTINRVDISCFGQVVQIHINLTIDKERSGVSDTPIAYIASSTSNPYRPSVPGATSTKIFFFGTSGSGTTKKFAVFTSSTGIDITLVWSSSSPALPASSTWDITGTYIARSGR